MKSATLSGFLDALRESRLLDQAQLTEVDALQVQCPEPQQIASVLLERGAITAYQAKRLLQGDYRSLVLGQYILLDLIGEGGMGQVFKARHQRMKRVVALKVIHKDLPAGPSAIQRFNKEIEAAAQLAHPNVVMAYDANEVGDVLFFVMEFVEGIDLGRLVARVGPLPVEQACDFTRQAALGLQHAHERGMVHRDIKPSNLLLTYSGGLVKILDMGLARLQASVTNDNSNLTRTGVVMGTPDFISPEQARDAHTADIRSDLYSLGCTLYFLLAGQPPFPEGSFTEKLLKHNMDEPQPLEQLRRDVPPEIVFTVRKLMAKRPQDRYQTPNEVAEALAPFARTMPSAECYRPEPSSLDLAPPPSSSAQPVTEAVSGMRTPGREAPGAPLSATVGLSVPGSKDPLPSWDTLPPTSPVSRVPPEKVLTDERPREAAVTQVKPRPPRRLVPVLIAMVLGVLFAGGIAFLVGPKGAGPADSGLALNHATTPQVQSTTPTTTAKVPDPPPPTVPVKPTRPEKPPETKKDKPPDPPPIFREGHIWTAPSGNRGDLPWQAALTRDGMWGLLAWSQPLSTKTTDFLKENRGSLYLRSFENCMRSSRPNFELPEYNVGAVALAPKDNRVLFGSTTEFKPAQGKLIQVVHGLALWEPPSAAPRWLLREKKETAQKPITAVAFASEGNLGLAGAEDGSVTVWDLRDRRELKTFQGHSDRVTCLAVSPDGLLAASGSRDRGIVLYDLEKFEVRKFSGSHTGIVSCLVFSPGSQYLLSGGYDNQITLWDTSAAEPSKQLVRTWQKKHTGRITCLAFAPSKDTMDNLDTMRFLSGSVDKTLRYWRTNRVEELDRFEEHNSSVLAVAFSDDGKFAVFICADGTFRCKELPPA